MASRSMFAVLLGAAVVVGGCGAAPDMPLPAPVPAPPTLVTVESVQTAQDVTLRGTEGYRVHNVTFEVAGSAPGSCEANSDTATARRLLLGRVVADVEVFRQWDDPAVPPGYMPAKLRFAVPGRPYGDDLVAEFSGAAARARAVACPRVWRRRRRPGAVRGPGPVTCTSTTARATTGSPGSARATAGADRRCPGRPGADV